VGTTPNDVVYQENKWSLLRYRARPEGLAHQTPILLIPSLINRHYVLDLMPGKSFIEYLVKEGFDVYCIDWGTPKAEDRYVTFDDIVDVAIGRAIRRTARNAPQKKAHVLGYCMGGTLAAIHGAAHPEHIASFIALAAPIRFDDGGLLARWTNSKGFSVDALIDGTGNVPWQLLQGAFHMLRPTLPLAKTVNVIDRAWNDEFLDGFFALEAWGNDNVALPGEFYRRYITELYQQNLLITGRFTLSGKTIDLKGFTAPTLAISFQNDNIVPASSASALLELIGATEKEHLDLPGGHVGAVVSKHAARALWPQLSSFFARHDVKTTSSSAEPWVPVVEVDAPTLTARELPASIPPERPKRKPRPKKRPGSLTPRRR
jgi:polyhydroxyalkanoate synthase